ncbi:MAG TPA: hypothetical protein GX527_10490 [Clostridiaceae bacterium]|nr:hypothetical protein [Clostridiaceae bacterium]
MTRGMLLILIINSALLLASTLLLCFYIAKKLSIKRVIKDRLNQLQEKYMEKIIHRGVKKYSRTKPIKIGFIERIDLYLIDKSNIRHYIPFVSFYFLLICCLIIFIISYQTIYKLLLFAPSTVILSILISFIPIFVLDLMGRYNSEKVRRKLAEFISVLNRWCSVKEDIFYAFEKCIDSGIGEPLNTFIRDMVIQVNRGISPMDALSILQMKVDNYQFRDFIINIKQNVKHRGDIKKLLDNLEVQFYKIEEEYNRRKISTYRDRLTIYFIMFLVLLTGYLFLKINPEVESFYLGTSQGKLLITIFCILYVLGFYLTLGISRFNY